MLPRISSSFLCLALVTGCASAPPDASVEWRGAEIPPGSGVVVAESLNNSTRITGFIDRWSELVLWRISDDDVNGTVSVSALSLGQSTQAYLGIVPAGTYAVGMLFAERRMGDRTYYGRALFPPAMGTFDVRAGQVTNLGTLMYQPFQARHRRQESYPDYATTRIANDDLWRRLRRVHPEVGAQVDGRLPVLGWRGDAHARIRGEGARLMKDFALPTRRHTVERSGTWLTGLNGGLYAFRDGTLVNHSLKRHYKINDLVELTSGELLVGGEFGTLSVGSPEGGFRDITLGEGLAHVVDLVRSDTGSAYVVTLAIDAYHIYRFDAATESLTLLKTLPKREPGIWGTELSPPASIGTSDGLAVFMDHKAHRYDEASGRWSEGDALEYLALFEQRDGQVLGVPYYSSGGGARPMQHSADDGRHWSAPIKEPASFGAGWKPTYRFADGELIRTGQDEQFRFSSFTWEMTDSVPFLSTTDAGVTWTAVGTAPAGCVDLAVEASSDDRVHILCIDGRIVSSVDRGTQLDRLERLPDAGIPELSGRAEG